MSLGDLDLSLLGSGLRLRVLSREKLGTGLEDLVLGAGAGLADLTVESLGLLTASRALSKAVIVGGDVSESLSSSEL